MTLKIHHDKAMNWVVFEAEAKGFIYRQILLDAMLEQCYSPAQVVTSIVNTMRRVLREDG